MICPLSPAHLAAFGALELFVLLLFFDARHAPLPLLCFVLLCCAAPFFPRLGFFLPVISRGKQGKTGVALTFDDGPDPAVTPRLLDLLARYDVPATFFVTGANAERHREIVREIIACGHTVGNHSYSHSPFLMLKGRRTLKREVEAAQRVLGEFGIVPLAFRPPRGITSPRLWRVLLELGMYCVTSSRRASGGGNRRVERLAVRLLPKVAPGDILLMHDVTPRDGDVEHLLLEIESLIRGLRTKGMELVPISRLIGKDVMQRGVSPAGPNPAELFYNGLAAGYDEEQFCSSVSISKKKEIELFSARLSELFAGAKRVLEIGAGTGIFTLPIARHCKEVSAVDISGNMLAFLKTKAEAEGLTNIRTVQGNAETCELEGDFSVVCAFASLEYVSDLPGLLSRLDRHVEPGGTLYFITSRRSLFRFFIQIGNAVRQGLWLKARSRGEMEKMLRRAGFEPVEISSHLLTSWVSGGMLLEVVARKAASSSPVSKPG